MPWAAESAEPPPAKRRNGISRSAFLEFFEAYALLILIFVIGAFFTLYGETSDNFLTSANLRVLVSNQAVSAIVALGALIPLILNEYDLSVGAIAGLVAVFVANFLSGGMAIPLAILIGVGFGLGVGAITGFLVTKLRINGVVATLAVSTLIAGVVTQKTGGHAAVSSIPESFTSFGATNFLGVPKVAWVLFAVAVLVYVLLDHTTLGRKLYAVGSNMAAAELVGLRTRVLIASTFVLAGGLCGLAGILYVSRAGGADPSVGPQYTLTGLAAAFLSAAAIKPGRFNAGGTIVAVFFLAILNNGLSLAGSPPYVASYVNGMALIVGVGLSMYLARKRRPS